SKESCVEGWASVVMTCLQSFSGDSTSGYRPHRETAKSGGAPTSTYAGGRAMRHTTRFVGQTNRRVGSSVLPRVRRNDHSTGTATRVVSSARQGVYGNDHSMGPASRPEAGSSRSGPGASGRAG